MSIDGVVFMSCLSNGRHQARGCSPKRSEGRKPRRLHARVGGDCEYRARFLIASCFDYLLCQTRGIGEDDLMTTRHLHEPE